jgi:hypothetical protein
MLIKIGKLSALSFFQIKLENRQGKKMITSEAKKEEGFRIGLLIILHFHKKLDSNILFNNVIMRCKVYFFYV